MPADTQFAVIEIGMNHPGEISPLAKLAQPQVIMITTVAAAHLEAFENIDGIAVEKASIMDGLMPGGIAVLNSDLSTSAILIDKAKAVGANIQTFGTNGDWALGDVRLTSENTIIQARHTNTDYLFKLATPGRHFAMNALGVIAVADAMGADAGIAAQDLLHWLPPQGRGTRETIQLDRVETEQTLDLIDDAFNANPTSMSAAFEVLAATAPIDGTGRIAKGRRIAILGDMLELGPDEIAIHESLAGDPWLQQADVIHCVGPRMANLFAKLDPHKCGHSVDQASDLVPLAHTLVDAGDVVLVKGSKGSKVSLVVDAIRKLRQR
jgi:UDP-N-acetylmuramoyl-tripeptide--D-alanyl-D-alanine ligase